MAVKPWIGCICDPTDPPSVDKSTPDVNYKLNYAYGYRCEDSRQNLFFNKDGNLVYMTAAIGVILDINANT
jgi:microtubule-associated protein-like 6